MKFFLLKTKRLVLQILFLLLCYFISRSVLVLLNIHYFSGITLWSFLKSCFFALRFDISAILVLNSLYILLFFLPVRIYTHPRWERITQIVFIIVNATGLAFEISDWAYFPFNLKRSTADVLDMVTRKGDFLSLLPHFITSFWYVPLAWIVVVMLLVQANKRIKKATPLQQTPEPTSWGYRAGQLGILILLAGLSLLGIRGGFNYVPIGIRDALTVSDSKFVPIVINTPFSIINTLDADELPALHYMSDEETAKYINPIKRYAHHAMNKKNVVVIILESFSKEYTGLGRSKGYTPFLDSLMGRSLICSNAFANGLHSAEGIPAVIAGIPALMESPFTTSVYGTNKITALPNVLKMQGYSSSFYHGGTNGTMAFDAFCGGAGYDEYYGRSQYNNEADYDGDWGIWDEPFLQYFAHGISTMKEPFITTVFTLSSHDPFSVPQKYKKILPSGPLPIEQTIAYTDMALRKFFETAAKQPWFHNTLFVITADHAAPVYEDVGYYGNNIAKYAIPIIYYAPGDTNLHGAYREVTQQIDILPSVLDYVGYGKPFFAYGNSIFSDTRHFAVEDFSGREQWLMNGYLLQANNSHPLALYAFPDDSACVNNILETDTHVMNDYLRYMQAFRQVFNNTLINNKMWVKDTAR